MFSRSTEQVFCFLFLNVLLGAFLRMRFSLFWWYMPFVMPSFHQLSHLYIGNSWIFLPVLSIAISTVSQATEVLAFYWTSFLLIIPRCSTWCIFTHAFFSILMVYAVCDDLFAEKNTYHIHMVPVASASSNLDLFLFHSHLPNPLVLTSVAV